MTTRMRMAVTRRLTASSPSTTWNTVSVLYCTVLYCTVLYLEHGLAVAPLHHGAHPPGELASVAPIPAAALLESLNTSPSSHLSGTSALVTASTRMSHSVYWLPSASPSTLQQAEPLSIYHLNLHLVSSTDLNTSSILSVSLTISLGCSASPQW